MMYTCPRCGEQNTADAARCARCGLVFGQPNADRHLGVQAREPRRRGRLVDALRELLGIGTVSAPRPAARSIESGTRFLTGRDAPSVETPSGVGRPVAGTAAQSTPIFATSARVPAPERGRMDHVKGIAAQPLKPLSRGLFHEHYQILNAWELLESVYYDAVDLICAVTGCGRQHSAVPADGLCVRCRAPLRTVLIHERRSIAGDPLSADRVASVLRLGRSRHPGVLYHHDLLSYQQATYAVVAHPGRWGSLTRGQRPRAQDDAVAMVAQVARVLTFLHQQGVALTLATPLELTSASEWRATLEKIISFGEASDVRVADLSSCRVPQAGTERRSLLKDVAFLGYLLLFLTTITEEIPADTGLAPPALRPYIERATQGAYGTSMALLSDLSTMPEPVPSGRSLKSIHGQASHPGRRHTLNEDAIVTFTYDKEQQGHSVPIGFYLVADGMGGHAAGDVASRTVNEVVAGWIIKTRVLPNLGKTTRKLTSDNVTESLLVEAVREANAALVGHAASTGSDLGSTVTAALVIGSCVTVVNVGDSRTYLLRSGALRQVTQDHSLVARLVDANVITPAEVRSHPQRNQIYRSLGHAEEVSVDTFTMPLQRGDRLILCSDGLWEMVEDADIRRVVEGARTPQQACDSLIEAANLAGGDDNISVIVVEME